jgi:hypothetical protein
MSLLVFSVPSLHFLQQQMIRIINPIMMPKPKILSTMTKAFIPLLNPSEESSSYGSYVSSGGLVVLFPVFEELSTWVELSVG